jgi:hypothetical protein
MTVIDWQTVVLATAAIVITIVLAAIAATEKITRKITKLEGRINEIEKNPYLEAFKLIQVEHAKTLLLKMDETIKGYEAQKIGKKEAGEEKK